MLEAVSFIPGVDLFRLIDARRVVDDVSLSRAAYCAFLLELGLRVAAPDCYEAADEPFQRSEMVGRRSRRRGEGYVPEHEAISFQVLPKVLDAVELWRGGFPIPPARAKAVKYFVEMAVRYLESRPRGKSMTVLVRPVVFGQVLPFKPKN